MHVAVEAVQVRLMGDHGRPFAWQSPALSAPPPTSVALGSVGGSPTPARAMRSLSVSSAAPTSVRPQNSAGTSTLTGAESDGSDAVAGADDFDA